MAVPRDLSDVPGKHRTIKDLQTYWLYASGAEIPFRLKVKGLRVWVRQSKRHIRAHERRPSESTVGLGLTRVGWVRERVVRQDSKDISPKQTEALCDFAQSRQQPPCEDSIGAGLVSKAKQEVIDSMTKKKNYVTFFGNYKREQVVRDPSWVVERSP